jgi:hypothetical protein
VFNPAGRNLAVVFRLVSTAVFLVAVGQLLGGLRLLVVTGLGYVIDSCGS